MQLNGVTMPRGKRVPEREPLDLSRMTLGELGQGAIKLLRRLTRTTIGSVWLVMSVIMAGVAWSNRESRIERERQTAHIERLVSAIDSLRFEIRNVTYPPSTHHNAPTPAQRDTAVVTVPRP